ncbi:MAG TPA: sulfite exporter TauE/SafE family protein [Jiangellaceae bacterium]|nr:sulfite exporter TauE/SafE family protein [Jiangellaceae bacterium]
MSLLEALAVVLAGLGAGAINTVVGSGSLVTFPTLLAIGLPPVVANVSNTVGLVPGSVSGAWGYRRELAGQVPRLLRLGAATLTGAVVGAVLLLVLPEAAFAAIVPVLILVACVLVVVQPWLVRWLGERPRGDHGGPLLWLLIFVTGAYGGYFGAGQGVLLIGVLGLGLNETLQRVNAAKNVLAGVANLAAGVIFAFVADVNWAAAGLVAIGAAAGGIVGAGVARRLPPIVLRAVVVVIGLVAVVTLR